MGAGASIPDSLDKDTAQNLAGDKWDESTWNSIAPSGTCTREQFLAQSAPGGAGQDTAATKIQASFRGKIARKALHVAGFAIRAATRFDYYKALGISEEELETIKACFNRYNVDNDNSISSNELRAAIHDMESSNDEHHVDPQGTEFARLFKSIDQNGNDEIELGEFCRWWVSGSDDMDSNFIKWWFKKRWNELCKDPAFLKSEVTPFVPPEMDEEIENAYAQGDVDIEEIKERLFPVPTVRNVPMVDGELTMTYAAFSQRGYYPESLNKANQDAFCIHTQFGGQADQHLFAVFDGHGQHGDFCSNFCKDQFPNNLQNYIEKIDATDAAAASKEFEKAVKFTDTRMHCSKDRLSGTTLVGAFIKGKTCVIGNVGDSRAVVGVQGDRDHLYAKALTNDQTPYRRDERDRCRKTGCRIMNMDQLEGYEEIHDNWDVQLGEEIDDGGDPPRIWHKSKNLPGCAFTRSLGDQIAEPWGVISDPEMVTRELTKKDKMLIIASDGVWEFITNQGCVDMCQKYKEPLDACRHVVAEAYKMWMIHDVRTDDITMILVEFNWNESSRAVVDHGTSDDSGFRHRGLTKEKQKKIDQSGISHDDSVPFDLAKHTFEKSDEVSKAIRSALSHNSVFQQQHVSSEKLDQAVACFEQVDCAVGDKLITQGAEGTFYYIAKSGVYDVHLKDPLSKPDDLGPVVHTYTTVHDDGDHGDCTSFGELSLLHPQPCAASVICKEAGTVYRLAKHPFREVLVQK